MKEAIFTSELVNSFIEADFEPFKIPDMPHFKGQKTRFDIKKPYDLYVLWKNKFNQPDFAAIECKQLKRYEAFGYRHMRPHQVEGLDRVVSKGHKAFVFLNIRQKAAKAYLDKKGKWQPAKPHINRLIIIRWPCNLLRYPGKSIKKDQLESLGYITAHSVASVNKKGKKQYNTRFDMKRFFNFA